MEVLVRTYDLEREMFVFTKLIQDDVGAMRFSPGKSFRAEFVHSSHTVYLSSCEDLVLIDNEKRQAALYNPVTKCVQLLPPTIIQAMPRSEKEREKCKLVFMCGTEMVEKCDLEFNCTGFGKDSATGEFKVIRNMVSYYETLDGDFLGCSNRYELYSLHTHSWKEIHVAEDDRHGLMSPWGSVFVNGSYYWPAFLGNGGGWGIQSFDFTSESFSSVQRPPITTVPYSTFLVELDQSCLGCLYTFKLSGESKLRFELWSRHKGVEPEWVLLKEFVLKNVTEPAGFVQGRFLFLEHSLSPDLKRLKVYDILEKKMERLDLYDNTSGMKVVSYLKKERATHLPDSEPLRDCNKKSVWKRHWKEILKKEEKEYEVEEEEEEEDSKRKRKRKRRTMRRKTTRPPSAT